MKYLKRNIFATLFLFLGLLPFISLAQSASEVEMADTFRQEGKIYVVIGIISLILLGIIIYLVMIDRKVAKMEKRIKGS